MERLRDYEALQRRRDAERAAEAAARLAMQVRPVLTIQGTGALVEPMVKSTLVKSTLVKCPAVHSTVHASPHGNAGQIHGQSHHSLICPQFTVKAGTH